MRDDDGPSFDELEDPLLPAASPAASPFARMPVTFLLLATYALVFVAELLLPAPGSPGGMTPSVSTLVALGGLDAGALVRGEPLRLVAATFLHGGPGHLVLNALALLMVGTIVEPRLGWRWFSVVYALGGVGGSLVSLATNDGTRVSVGASGAIMGLFAAGLFLARTLPPHLRGPSQFQLARVLVPSMLPIATGGGGRVDVGAHLGGAIAGGLAGLALLVVLGRASRTSDGVTRVRRSPAALAVLVPWAVLCAATLRFVVAEARPRAFAEEAALASLLPNAELPHDAPSRDAVRAWLERFPDDPRVRLFAVDLALEAGDLDAAAAHVAHARETLPRVRPVFDDATSARLAANVDDAATRLGLVRRLLPDRELPAQGDAAVRAAAWAQGLDGWLRDYPDDPRVRHRAAARALERALGGGAGREEALAEAEAHARHGLGQVRTFVPVFGGASTVGPWLELVLGVVEREAGRSPSVEQLALCRRDDAVGEAARAESLCPGAAPPPPPGP